MDIRFRNAANSRLGSVKLAGSIRKGHGVPADPMRVLGSYALVYVVDGGGRYVDANGTGREVRTGDLILLFPELAHGYGPVGSQRWTEFYMVFEGPVFDLWRESGVLDPAHPIHRLKPVDYWLQRLESVLDAPEEPGLSPALLEVSRLQLTLAEMLLGQGARGSNPADAEWVSQACALLESDLSKDLELGELARDLGTTYDGFRKKFTRTVGVPPARYRSIRTIDRACELMQRGNLTDRQISEKLGFRDEFYFSRRFKQIIGSSPRGFRKSLPHTEAP